MNRIAFVFGGFIAIGVWICLSAGVSSAPGEPSRADLANGGDAQDKHDFVMALCRDPLGKIWVGCEDSGLWRFDPASGAWDRPIERQSIYAIARDRKNRIWAGTLNHGVFVVSGNQIRNYDVIGGPNALAGPLGERVFKIAVCPTDGDVWMATSAGLTRYSEARDQWSYFTRAQGLPTNQTDAIAFDAAGTIFVGTQCDGICMANASDDYTYWRTVRRDSDMEPTTDCGPGLPSNLLNDILVARDGTIYAATDAGLAHSSDHGKTWAYIRGADWIAKVQGLANPPKDWKATVASTVSEDYCTCLAEGPVGQIWVGHRSAPVDVLSKSGMQQIGQRPFVTALLGGPNAYAGTYGNSLVEIRTASQADAGHSAPSIAAPLPSGAPAPDLAGMNGLLAEMGTVRPGDGPDTPSVIGLDDDWRTQGDWLGRYGRYSATLCGMDSQQYVWGAGPNAMQCVQQDGCYYMYDAYVDNHKAMEMPPGYLDGEVKSGRTTLEVDRQEAEWNDGGFDTDKNQDGPDLYCYVKIPAGQYILSLYDFNKDGHHGRDRTRDDPVIIHFHPDAEPPVTDDLNRIKQFPKLATNRVVWFWGDVYEKYLVQAPIALNIEMKRNHTFSCGILNGIMLDLPDERPVPYFKPVDQWRKESDDRLRHDKAIREHWLKNPKLREAEFAPRRTGEAAARALLEKLDEMRTWNPRYWAINQRRFAVELTRWCQENLAGARSPEAIKLRGSCLYQAGYYPQWETCQTALGETPARQIEKSLERDGAVPGCSGGGYQAVAGYLGQLPPVETWYEPEPTTIDYAMPFTAAVSAPLRMDQVGALMTSLSAEQVAVLVTYQSDMTNLSKDPSVGPDLKLEPFPLTYVANDFENNSATLHLQGHFELVKALNLDPPPLGRANVDLALKKVGPSHFGGGYESWVDAAMKQLYVLIPTQHRPQIGLFVAAGENGNGFLTFTFRGPFMPEQQTGVESVANYVIQHPLEGLSHSNTQALLADADFAKVQLGLAWLDKQGTSMPADYFSAIVRSPDREMPDLIDHLFLQGIMSERFGKDLPAQLDGLIQRNDVVRVVDVLECMRRVVAQENGRAYCILHGDGLVSEVARMVAAKDRAASADPSQARLRQSLHHLLAALQAVQKKP